MSIYSWLRHTLAFLHRQQGGQVIILAAGAMVVLLGFTALAIDVGVSLEDRRQAQNAADAGALAGAHVLLEQGSSSQAMAAAQDYAGRNGFDGGNGGGATVNVPPTQGSHAGNTSCVEVVASRTQQAIFARVLGKDRWDVSSRAVACIESSPKPYSIIALNPTAADSFKINGNVDITVTGAGTFTNSEHATQAFNANGNVDVHAAVNDVVGGWKLNGNVDIEPSPSKAAHIQDPLASLSYPTPPSSPVRTCPTLNGNGSYTFQPGKYDCAINPNGNWTLIFSPGDYYVTGGINLNGNINVTFGAGTYTVGGQGLKVNGNTSITGQGVTFYNDNGCIDMNGNASLHLSAPHSGPYEGILFFQKRTNTCEVKVNGNAAAGNWGTIYAAGAQITFNGNAHTGYQFISDKFLATGNVDIDIDFDDSVMVGAPKVRLAE